MDNMMKQTVYTGVVYTPNSDGSFVRGCYVGGAYDSDLTVVSSKDLEKFKTEVVDAILQSCTEYPEVSILVNGDEDDKLRDELMKLAAKERAKRKKEAEERAEAERALSRAKAEEEKRKKELALFEELRAKYGNEPTDNG